MSAVTGLVDGFRERSGELSLLDRLDDFRGRLISSALCVVITTLVGFLLTTNFDVLGIVIAPIQPFLRGEKLKYLSPTDPFFITLKLALCIGIGLALPYLIAQAWSFVAPLMRPEEKRLVKPAIAASVAFFAAGVVFCYYLILPLMLRFTMGFQTESLEQQIIVGAYIKLFLRLILSFGLAFELPIVILVGTALGIVTPEFLASKRRHAIAILVIASALITPPDVSSLILLAIPMLLLFEISIVLSRAVVARRPAAIPMPEAQ